MIPTSVSLRVLGFLLLALGSGNISGQTDGLPATEPKSVVENFHRALAQGDRTAVLSLLSEDAMILENGESQTRSEYEREHLGEDIAFAKAVPSVISNLTVRQEGSVAWTTATIRASGRFQDREINSAGLESMILTKTDAGWRIRAIHWSSHKLPGKP